MQVLTLAELPKMLGVVVEVACSRHLVGPSLGVGGEFVAPHERRNFNVSALAVVHGQDVLLEIGRRLIIGIIHILRHAS
jgi:hypothetical protein